MVGRVTVGAEVEEEIGGVEGEMIAEMEEVVMIEEVAEEEIEQGQGVEIGKEGVLAIEA